MGSIAGAVWTASQRPGPPLPHANATYTAHHVAKHGAVGRDQRAPGGAGVPASNATPSTPAMANGSTSAPSWCYTAPTDQHAQPRLTEVIVAKARDAECATIELEFEGAHQRYRHAA